MPDAARCAGAIYAAFAARHSGSAAAGCGLRRVEAPIFPNSGDQRNPDGLLCP
jgi:hypothetical protein